MSLLRFTLLGIDDVSDDVTDSFECCATDGKNIYLGTQSVKGNPKIVRYYLGSWSDITQNFPSTIFTSVSSMHYNAGNLYIGTGGNFGEYGRGTIWVHKGVEWESLELPFPASYFTYSIRSIVASGKAIFAAGSAIAGSIWKYENEAWTSILSFGSAQDGAIQELKLSNDRLAVTSLSNSYTTDASLIEYIDQTWVSRSTRYIEQRFGDQYNLAIAKICYYNNDLYAATHNDYYGTKIYRLNADGSWTQINQSGFGSNQNYSSCEMTVIGNQLVVVTENVSGSEIWAYTPSSGWTEQPMPAGNSYTSYMLLSIGRTNYLIGRHRRVTQSVRGDDLLSSQDRTRLNIRLFPYGTVGTVPGNQGTVTFIGPQKDLVIVDGSLEGQLTTVRSLSTEGTFGFMDPIQNLKSDALTSLPEQIGAWAGTGTNFYSGGPVYKDPNTGIIIVFCLAKKGYWTSTGEEGTEWDYSRKYIRLAASTDNGTSFIDLGAIITPNDPANSSRTDYLSTPAYWIKDGYIYIYYYGDKNIGQSVNSLSLARANFNEFIAAAAAGTVSSWYKYYNGSFSQPGLGGMSENLLSDILVDTEWIHGIFSRNANKFLIFFNSATHYKDTNLYFSNIVNERGMTTIRPKNAFVISTEDGIHFSRPQKVHTSEVGCLYPSLVGKTSHLGYADGEFQLLQFAANDHLYTLGSEDSIEQITVPRFTISAYEPEIRSRLLSYGIYARPVVPRIARGWEGEISAQSTRSNLFGNGDKKIPIYPVATEEEFLNINIPTRIEPIVAFYTDLQPFSTRLYGRKVSYFNEVYDTIWKVEDGKIREKSFGATEWDIFAEYDIRDLTIGEENQYGSYDDSNVTIEPLLSCLRMDKLFILAKETDYDRFNYVIKICDPKETTKNNYLESITDFLIEIPLESSQFYGEIEEAISSLAFSDLDPNVMMITTTQGKQLFYRLYFDYYYNDVDTNKIYLLEKYPSSKIQVM